ARDKLEVYICEKSEKSKSEARLKCEGRCKRALPKREFDQTETSDLKKKRNIFEAGVKRDTQKCAPCEKVPPHDEPRREKKCQKKKDMQELQGDLNIDAFDFKADGKHRFDT
ncbi:unnamed protein product, partial [Prorocentrum cordatum]